ncbi:MAG: replicative DNA helicase [Firmicutes bacterium]|nr:replicative DNA helicase [Bacillota bacterium]
MTERIPPHSIEAEKSVLGAILMDKDVFFAISEHIKDEDFYSDAHKEIFRAMVDLYRRGEPLDVITVCDSLTKRGSLETVGGRAYVALLSTEVPTTANAVQYAQMVAEKAVLRKLIATSGRITEEAFSERLASRDVLDSAERSIMEISRSGKGGDFSYIRTVMQKNLEAIRQADAAGGQLPGLSTGYRDLDRLTTGLKPADLVIIAARPSMGKTALGVNIAHNAAVKGGARVVIFSLEMPDTGLGLRLLSLESRVDLRKLQTGELTTDEWDNIIEASERISKADIIIDQSTAVSVMEMRNRCRRLAAEKPLDLILIDYLQLMESDGKEESHQLAVASISRYLKQLGREMNCPVIVISQLSRAVEKRTGDPRPMLSDLRDSGAIEQDADVVIFIYRPDYYKAADEAKDNIAEIIVAKNRNGETGSVNLTWLPQFTRFANIAREPIPGEGASN